MCRTISNKTTRLFKPWALLLAMGFSSCVVPQTQGEKAKVDARPPGVYLSKVVMQDETGKRVWGMRVENTFSFPLLYDTRYEKPDWNWNLWEDGAWRPLGPGCGNGMWIDAFPAATTLDFPGSYVSQPDRSAIRSGFSFRPIYGDKWDFDEELQIVWLQIKGDPYCGFRN